LDRRNALELIYRRARQAGIATQIGCHTFRATGITIYLTNGGTLEKAQMMAAHSSPRTTTGLCHIWQSPPAACRILVAWSRG
jgi:integrase